MGRKSYPPVAFLDLSSKVGEARVFTIDDVLAENAKLKEALRGCVDFLVSIEHGTALPVGSSFDHSPRYCPVCQFSGVGIRKHLDGCELEKNLTKVREVLGEVPSP